MSSTTKNGSIHQPLDSIISEILPPPPPDRNRMKIIQKVEAQSGSRYEGPTTLQDSSRAIFGDVYETHNYVQAPNPAPDQAKGKRLVESLIFKGMGARLHNVKTALKDTGEWVFSHPTFTTWMDELKLTEHGGFLWIKGKPGCGKSTLMKRIHHWAKERAKQPWIILSYFFNARASEALEKSTLGLYRSFTYDILRVTPRFVDLFDEMFRWKEVTEDVDWTIEELQEFLIAFAQADWRPSTVFFIDALDEGNDGDIRDLVSFLDDVRDHAQHRPPLRICLSSRHYSHITIKTGLTLFVETQTEHDHDIQKYVHKKLTGYSDAEMVGLRAMICERAMGIFLWVVLVIPLLNQLYDQGKSAANSLVYLQRLPKGLEGFFVEILTRDDAEAATCVSLLEWCLFSYATLSPTELYLAVQYSCPDADRDVAIVPTKSALVRYILHHSRGLVEITRSDPPMVQFIHETVREFLTGDFGLKQVDTTMSENLIGSAHARLAQACSSYLLLNCSESKLSKSSLSSHIESTFKRLSDGGQASLRHLAKLRERLPLLQYAAANILRHAETAQQSGISQVSLLKSLETSDGLLGPAYRRAHNICEDLTPRRYGPVVTLLDVVAEKAFEALSSSLVLASKSSDAAKSRWRYGSTLELACAAGNEATVQSLLAAGAEVYANGALNRSAFDAALVARHHNIFILLIRRVPAHVTMPYLRPDFLEAVLLAATRSSDIETMKLLLQHGVRAHWFIDVGSSLLAAAKRGFVEAFNLLLEDTAETLVRGYLKTVLRQISHHSDTIVAMRALSYADEEFNSQRLWSTIFDEASKSGDTSVVKMLLDSGLLSESSACGYVDSVRLLLDARLAALLEASNRRDTPVMRMMRDEIRAITSQVTWKEDIDTLRVLLGAGVSFDDGDGSQRDGLFEAACEGREKVLEVLLDYTKDINAEVGFDGNALHIASYEGHKDAVLTMLIRGADVNARGPFGTALHLASERGHLTVAQILLDNRADVEAQGPFGTALQKASSYGHTAIVRLLLDRGAEPNTPGPLGTALQCAQRREHSDVVQLLTQRGARTETLEEMPI